MAGSSADVIKVTDGKFSSIISKPYGDGSGLNADAASNGDHLVVAGPFQHQWEGPTYYGTDMGIIHITGDQVEHIDSPRVSSYDWEAKVDIDNEQALISWRNGSDVKFVTYNLATRVLSSAHTIALGDNAGLRVIDPDSALIDSSHGVAIYFKTIIKDVTIVVAFGLIKSLQKNNFFIHLLESVQFSSP